jgi:Concanavalin A-like lectin/glucanases superfamily/F5/8 type C domain/Amylo-alpha-1,6-glucosidase
MSGTLVSKKLRAWSVKALPLITTLLGSTFVSPDTAQADGTNILPTATLASQKFGNDAPWYVSNIPFFECSDSTISDVYYYRWSLYKSHLKDLGNQGFISTEFLGDVSWAISPFQSLNDATPFHIRDGRWVKNARYVNDYIHYMFADGGNDRHFSEAITDATYANFLARGDLAFASRYLTTMQSIYNAWANRYDSTKGLYWVEPLYDATEYTIASIDASNGVDGFGGGNAFRPSINSYMYANAQAISKLASLNGDNTTAQTYATRAAAIKSNFQSGLWNSSFQHFTDRFQVTNTSATVATVAYWNFIRGRELVGYVPWYFGMPDDSATYAASWNHLLSTSKFYGPYGLRTVEPTYQYYLKQYRYEGTSPECQWNGPSWPFQTTQVLGGMANLLNDYTNKGPVTADRYVGVLRRFAQQHYSNGILDLQEDMNPDTGKVIVGLARSHHYNHSSFVDLVITGLAGLRPRADNTLEINPLIPTGDSITNPISYLCLENVSYHGHLVTILYDKDGSRYNLGAGLSVYVDGALVSDPGNLEKRTVAISAPILPAADTSMDLAINFTQRTYPAPSASYNNVAANLFPALDGRVWYWSNVANYWSNNGSTNSSDWYAVNFGANKTFSSVVLNFYSDAATYSAPNSYEIQYWTGSAWAAVPDQQKSPASPIGNGDNTVTFPALDASQLRVVFENPAQRGVALVEFKAMGEPAGVKYVDLRATDASAGTTSWTNRGTSGTFSKIGSPSLVANVANTGYPGVLFNGTTDAYQGAATSVDLDGSSDRTIEVWAFNPSLASEETTVSWGYRGSTRQNLAFNFGSNAGWGAVTHYSDDVGWGGSAPSASAWHHLVYTYSSRGVRIYVDGKYRTSKILGAELNTYTSQPINVGCQRDSAGGTRSFFYSGYLNTVRIYGGALTPAQVQTLYATGPAALPATPQSLAASRTSDTSVTLTWSAVSGATSYKISRSADAGQTWTLIASTTGVSYLDTPVILGTSYQYRIQAVSDNGESSASQAVNAAASAYAQWKIDTGLGETADDLADPDGDGQNNRDEYAAGTHPLNGSDVFKIASISHVAATYVVTLNGKANRSYILQRSTDLNASSWSDIDLRSVTGNDATVQFIDPDPPAGKAFYRIKTTTPRPSLRPPR